MTNQTADKRVVKVTMKVFIATVSTGWNQSALILEDNSGDVAPRRVTLKIERPLDIEYIREGLKQIEDAWRKELDSLKVSL